jgi:hypothetical protein
VALFDENMKLFFTLKTNLLTSSLDLDPDPELDPHSSKRLDPDPHIMNADPKHWFDSMSQ